MNVLYIYRSTHANNRNGRAVGIEYTSDTILSQGASDELVVVKAAKLVVVSAGAFGSPCILERSGIGAPSVLKKNNVDLVVDLPGVGENYQGMSLHRRSRFKKTVVLQTTSVLVWRSTHQTKLKPWMMCGVIQRQSPVSSPLDLVIQRGASC